MLNTQYVLIAEDDVDKRAELSAIVKKYGMRVIEVADGMTAWQFIENGRVTGSIAAVFADLEMPMMGGLDLLEMVRADNRFAALPLVLCCEVSDNNYAYKAQSLYVDGYLLKPTVLERVEAKLEQFFPELVNTPIAKAV